MCFRIQIDDEQPFNPNDVFARIESLTIFQDSTNMPNEVADSSVVQSWVVDSSAFCSTTQYQASENISDIVSKTFYFSHLCAQYILTWVKGEGFLVGAVNLDDNDDHPNLDIAKETQHHSVNSIDLINDNDIRANLDIGQESQYDSDGFIDLTND